VAPTLLHHPLRALAGHRRRHRRSPLTTVWFVYLAG
jgi:hypothetical protein